MSSVQSLAGALVLLALVVVPALAQVPINETGAQIDERFAEPTAPLAQPPGERLQLDSTEAPPAAAQITINLLSVQVTGNSAFSQAELETTTTWPIGQVALLAIYQLAADLTAVYQDSGYFLSRVIVPPQALNPAAATIQLQVIEGYIDEVSWPQTIINRTSVLEQYTNRITRERPLSIATLERYLLLAGDLPGYTISTTLEPSATNSGASRLVVDIDHQPFSGSATLNNRGSESRGPLQVVAQVSAENSLGLNERVALTFASATEFNELTYVSGSYQQVLNAEGLELSLRGTWDQGEPGTEILRSLDYQTRSGSFAGELSFPIIRSRERNLILSGGFTLRDFRSDSLGAALNEDRTRAFHVSATYDQFDVWNGVNQLSLTFRQGLTGLGGTNNANPLATRASGRVDFTVFEGSASRFQPLQHGLSLLLEAEGQYAATPLLAGQECSYGSQRFGSAFSSASLVGDHCLMGSAELRYDSQFELGDLSQAQLFAYLDHGVVWQRAGAGIVTKETNATSVGVGARLAWNDHLFGEVEVTHQLAGATADHSWHGFFSVGARF